MFAAPARIADKCSACRLNFAELERGSRAAGLVTIAVAGVLIGVALWLENAFRPPIILQMIVWTVLTVAVVLGALRGFKTFMLMASYERQQEREVSQEKGEQ